MQIIGVIIIVVGFLLKLDTIAVVLLAGIATGFAANMDLMSILDTLGSSFIQTRYMSIFLITLPVIGILERNGMKNSASKAIARIKGATANNILIFYSLIRMISISFGIRASGHVQFIRPIIFPMIENSFKQKNNSISPKQIDTLKATSCAVDNYSNFFAQNIFVANAGVLLIVGTLSELGYPVENFEIARISIMMAIITIILTSIYNGLIIKTLEKRG